MHADPQMLLAVIDETMATPAPEEVSNSSDEFCWVCRLCGKESKWLKPGTTEFPKNFVNDPELGVICKDCFN